LLQPFPEFSKNILANHIFAIGRGPNFGMVRTFLPFGLAVRLGIAALTGNTIGAAILRNPDEVVGRLLSTGPTPQRAQD
jgi:hypothetical protein